MKKYDRTISIPLTEGEYDKICGEAIRCGYKHVDYRRMLLLSSQRHTVNAWEEYYWDGDTLEDIRTDVRRLLWRQLHFGAVEETAVLEILKRLEGFSSRLESGADPWRS